VCTPLATKKRAEEALACVVKKYTGQFFIPEAYFHWISVPNVKILSPLIQNSPPTEQRGRFCSASVPIGRSLVHSPPHDHGREEVLQGPTSCAAAAKGCRRLLASDSCVGRPAPSYQTGANVGDCTLLKPLPKDSLHQPSHQLAIGLAATVTSGRVSPPVIFKSASHLNHFTVILLSTT